MTSPFTPAEQRGLDALTAQLESLPAFRERREAKNRSTLVEAGFPTTNDIVNGLPAACLRLYIRALRSAAHFRCDIVDRSVLVDEDVGVVVGLMNAHLFERTEVGIRIHAFTATSPCAADLINPNESDDE